MDQLIKDRYNDTILQETMRRNGIAKERMHSLDVFENFIIPPTPSGCLEATGPGQRSLYSNAFTTLLSSNLQARTTPDLVQGLLFPN